jgi:hypothetical protein
VHKPYALSLQANTSNLTLAAGDVLTFKALNASTGQALSSSTTQFMVAVLIEET